MFRRVARKIRSVSCPAVRVSQSENSWDRFCTAIVSVATATTFSPETGVLCFEFRYYFPNFPARGRESPGNVFRRVAPALTCNE